MTKKSATAMVENASENSDAHLSRRVPKDTMKKIDADMDVVARMVRDGSIRPSFPVMAEFIEDHYGVSVTKTTAQVLYNKAKKRIRNDKV